MVYEKADLESAGVGDLGVEQGLLQGAEGQRLPPTHHHQVNVAATQQHNL